MNQEQFQFVEDLGQVMAGWGLPRTTGRIYGYLLLQGQPASSDEIAGALELAKSGVSVAIRQLLALGLARSAGERGSRRLHHEAYFDVEAIIAARNAQMLEFVERLQQGARAANPGRPRQRLAAMAGEIQRLMDSIRDLIQRADSKRRAG